MTNWNQPMCDDDWNFLHSGDGREPVRLIEREDEICAWCGKPTRSGIYVRANPDDVEYPTP